jgi:hypothetical protein
MDLYYPPDHPIEGRRPAVIIVAGYRGRYKDVGWTVSMAQLIAMSGMIAIAYSNREPVSDLQALITHVHERPASLDIVPSRIGIMAVSGNVPTALSIIMEETSRPPLCAAFSYGCLLDLDGATDVADAARQFGFANPVEGRSVAHLRHDVPLLIVRAGQNHFPAMNTSIDRFMHHAVAANLPITFINYAQGQHAFDLLDDNSTSRDILRQTLGFLRRHLLRAEPDGVR